MVTPKQTWKRLHELTTTPVAWHDYLAAVEQYADSAQAPPKRKRRKRGKRKKRSNLDQQ